METRISQKVYFAQTPFFLLFNGIFNFQFHPAETVLILSGACTINCKTMHAALVALGVESFSALCNGGNKKLCDVLNPKDPNMQFWIMDAG